VALECKRPYPDLTAKEVFDLTLEAATQVGRPMFFSMLIIILAFVPVFLLSGQEGKLFHPLAYTKSFALLGAVLLAITAVPVFCTLLVRGPFKPEHENWLMKSLLKIYDPVLDWALTHRKSVLGAAFALLAACLVIAFGLPRKVNSVLGAWSLPPGWRAVSAASSCRRSKRVRCCSCPCCCPRRRSPR
jgi:Cu(I)/Ag(I) efflux system membrane protein CusA/SilA